MPRAYRPIRGCPLRNNQNADKDEDEQRGRCRVSTQRQAAGTDRLVEKIPYDGSERPGQDERRPEEECSREARPEVSRRHHSQQSTKDNGTTDVSKAGRVG